MEELVTRYSRVQLATLVDAPPEGDNWLHEIKYDGYRLLAFLEQDDVKLYTRNGNDWTRRFPAVHASFAQVKAHSAVLDMEAVVTEPSGRRTSFHALQQALGNNGNSGAIIAYVFDVLYLNGQDLSATPQIERKNRLDTLFKQSQGAFSLHYSEHVTGNGAAMLAHACELGLEGIVSKRADAPYRTGRQRSWLKAKCIKRQEFIIVGFSAAQAGFRAIGALYLGYMKEGRLTYAGKVGTGYTMEEAAGIYQKLAAMEVKTHAAISLPRAEARYIHWVKPELLCEVAFVEWTEEGHIRHGSFQGLREDKQAGAVQREMPKPVKEAALTRPPRARLAGLAKADAADPVFEGVTITHPSRIIDPATGVTKSKLAEYYALVSPYLLRNVSGHALTLIRCPEGINGERFYQRSVGTGLGADVKPFKWKHKGTLHDYFYTETIAGLRIPGFWCGAIERHQAAKQHRER